MIRFAAFLIGVVLPYLGLVLGLEQALYGIAAAY